MVKALPLSDTKLEAAKADAEARASIAAGKGVAHVKVMSWLQKLAQGKVEPPPCA